MERLKVCKQISESVVMPDITLSDWSIEKLGQLPLKWTNNGHEKSFDRNWL